MTDHPANAERLQLVVRRTIPRPVAEVWEAWITPAAIAEWMTMPGSSQVKVHCEPRRGGKLVIDLVHEGRPWREDGTFLDVVPGKLLHFTWVTPDCPGDVGSTVRVDFADRDGATELTLTHTGFPSPQERDSHDAGWQQILGVIVAASKTALSAATLARA